MVNFNFGGSEGSLTDNDSIWNFAGAHSLVIVTANVPASSGQRIDIEILDGSDQGNVYLSKRVSPAVDTRLQPRGRATFWSSCGQSTLTRLGYQRGDETGRHNT